MASRSSAPCPVPGPRAPGPGNRQQQEQETSGADPHSLLYASGHGTTRVWCLCFSSAGPMRLCPEESLTLEWAGGLRDALDGRFPKCRTQAYIFVSSQWRLKAYVPGSPPRPAGYRLLQPPCLSQCPEGAPSWLPLGNLRPVRMSALSTAPPAFDGRGGKDWSGGSEVVRGRRKPAHPWAPRLLGPAYVGSK